LKAADAAGDGERLRVDHVAVLTFRRPVAYRAASSSINLHAPTQPVVEQELIAKATGISRAQYHCSRLTTVQDIQDYASL